LPFVRRSGIVVGPGLVRFEEMGVTGSECFWY
jgi:hypothetical protein